MKTGKRALQGSGNCGPKFDKGLFQQALDQGNFVAITAERLRAVDSQIGRLLDDLVIQPASLKMVLNLN